MDVPLPDCLDSCPWVENGGKWWKYPWRRIAVLMSDGSVDVSVDDEDFVEWMLAVYHVCVMKSGGDESEICGKSVVLVVVGRKVVDCD